MDKSNAEAGPRLPFTTIDQVVIAGQGVEYLLRRHAASQQRPVLSLDAIEGSIRLDQLFAEIDSCSPVFIAAVSSKNASLVGSLVISIRRGMALRAYLATKALPGRHLEIDPLLCTPAIAAQIYAAALPSLLSKVSTS